MGIRAVLFDADGVIQRPRADWAGLLGEGRAPGGEVDAFLDDLFAAERTALTGGGDFLRDVEAVLARWECAGTLDDARRLWKTAESDPEAIAVVRAVRRVGVACHLATNQQEERARHMSETLGYARLFDREFYSCRLGVVKPDPAYFQAIVADLGLAPERLLFVDDHAENVESARRCGLGAFCFDLADGTAALRPMLREAGVPLGRRLDVAFGPAGAAEAAARGDVVVIVDTLSFSTSVTTAIARGAEVYPRTPGEETRALAEQIGAEVAVPRGDWPEKGRYCLSPTSFATVEPGARVVLPSPNGAASCRATAGAPRAFVGCLANASAVAAALDADGRPATVVVCREVYADGRRRDALEDVLGAGAILAASRRPRTAAAEEVAAAFEEHRPTLLDSLLECESGQELIARGFREDVERAAALDAFDVVPELSDGRIA